MLATLGVVGLAAFVWGIRAMAAQMAAAREEARRGRALEILNAFAPAVAQAQQDPRVLLAWQPLARAARQIFPDEFASLDRATGAHFPFPPERVQAAHAQWTADWLAWERAHDAEYKVKAAEAERDAAAGGPHTPLMRARFEAIEREKLELYQRRYEEYIKVAKALQALIS